jgi:hypothetical protein
MESNLKIQQGANDGWFIYKDNNLLLGSHNKELIEKIKVLLDETEIEKVVLSVLDAYSLSVLSLYATKENPKLTDRFIRDTDGQFRKISSKIAKKLTNVDER